jgi:hypothetical protein
MIFQHQSDLPLIDCTMNSLAIAIDRLSGEYALLYVSAWEDP